MKNFSCDYLTGAHPTVLEAIVASNQEKHIGYSEDDYCTQAKTLIRQYVGKPLADVHFLVGGTQTNMVFIASVLRPHQGAVCADTGHINVHETGAIEACGHKVLALNSPNGKITAQQIDECFYNHIHDVNFEHMVQPGLVYISQPTECGTLYTKNELTDIYNICKKYNAPLYIDGARLAYALGADKCDTSITELAERCDAFYIGGTKVGTLFGEALVITNPQYTKDFRYLIKQKGALLAKGRLLGVQFKALMTNNLYQEIGTKAVRLAQQLQERLKQANIPLLYESPTNQVFPIFNNEHLQAISNDITLCHWCNIDDTHTAVRICTSWETSNDDINDIMNTINKTINLTH